MALRDLSEIGAMRERALRIAVANENGLNRLLARETQPGVFTNVEIRGFCVEQNNAARNENVTYLFFFVSDMRCW
jgi:hypothetical protein